VLLKTARGYCIGENKERSEVAELIVQALD
jgi:hypothetical protein